MELEKQVGVIICTHNRVADAKINQEIIRKVWPSESLLKDAVIVHSYNGQRDWYPQAYLEDDLLRSNNSNLSQGNADLIDNGLIYLHQQYPSIRYAIVLNADTWLIRPEYIAGCLNTMITRHYLLAASSYAGEKSEFFRGGLATDFFIVDVPFAVQSGMFPLKYREFQDAYWEMILYYSSDMSPLLEKLLFARFAQSLHQKFPAQNPADTIREKLLRMHEREPFYEPGSDTRRLWYWPEAGVLSDHDLERKRKILKEAGLETQGRFMNEFVLGEI